ncbi:hypothetical protein P691DRAFT_783792 [Macrolepiota fuliginosa MF-IS2]|uniref:Uncharacterized protein n=1 Tax=Macrolepiota fuliginosa MF-IS2 TaxID=1400762 RepID=A0A9P5WWD8_9AGAR|nr:hypothetical protein P691DRAFT_783792 [Macrolepiota fuliginosa MF-IS2]
MYVQHVINVNQTKFDWTFEEAICALYDQFILPMVMHDAREGLKRVHYDSRIGIQGYYDAIMENAQCMTVHPDDYTLIKVEDSLLLSEGSHTWRKTSQDPNERSSTMEQLQTGGTNYNICPQRVSQGMIVLNEVGASHSSNEGDKQALLSEDENKLVEVKVVESEYGSYSDKNDFLTTISDKPIEVLSDYGSDNEWNTEVPNKDTDIGNVDD